jgi:branched-chain amino acid transport system substrate-binding protein
MRKLQLHAAMLSAALAVALVATPASAQKKYDTGATDTEIKIGNTIAYSAAPRSHP